MSEVLSIRRDKSLLYWLVALDVIVIALSFLHFIAPFVLIAVIVVSFFLLKKPQFGLYAMAFGLPLTQSFFNLAGIERSIFGYSSLIVLALFFYLSTFSRNLFKIPSWGSGTIFLNIYAIFILYGALISGNQAIAWEKFLLWMIFSYTPFLLIQYLQNQPNILARIDKDLVLTGFPLLFISIIVVFTSGNVQFERFSAGSKAIWYARSMGLFSILSLYCGLREKRSLYQFLYLFLYVLGFSFVGLAATRMPFISTIFVSILIVFYVVKIPLPNKIILVSLVSGSVMFLLKKFANFILLRMAEVQSSTSEASASHRLIMYKTAFDHVWDKPLIGHGLGFFKSLPSSIVKVFGLHSSTFNST
jgi:hypothetical protein